MLPLISTLLLSFSLPVTEIIKVSFRRMRVDVYPTYVSVRLASNCVLLAKFLQLHSSMLILCISFMFLSSKYIASLEVPSQVLHSYNVCQYC